MRLEASTLPYLDRRSRKLGANRGHNEVIQRRAETGRECMVSFFGSEQASEPPLLKSAEAPEEGVFWGFPAIGLGIDELGA